jgi:gliding motility-associated-like protein
VYNETGTNPNCTAENSFVITINQTPLADTPSNVTNCDSFILPSLTNGNYFTQSGGNGTALFAGDAITSTQTIFVYNATATNPNCTAENSFLVTINLTPLADAPSDVTNCDSYILPSLTNGNYFTQSGGNGMALFAGNSITSTQTIFVYNETATNPNCTAENSFFVTINQSPTADFEFKNAEVDLINPEIVLINNSFNGIEYIWDFGDSEHSNEKDPTHSYKEAQNYTVNLIVFSLEGCTDSISKSIHVIEPLIYYIPNTFTPNGDEHNNTFQPIFSTGYDPFNYHLTIFDRWGEQIFESKDPAVGWDGSYKNLGHVEQGTYIWKINFGLTMNSQVQSIVGNVNIIE